MKKLPGRCVFCHGVGLTIWPKWLKKINQPQMTEHLQVRFGAFYFAPRRTRNITRRQGHAGTRKTRKVCKRCNNGWIQRLEERIREPLTHMMAGEPIILKPETQRDLAAWAALVTMMVEFTDPSTLTTNSDEYKYLFETGEVPPNWKVWVARYLGNNPQNFVCRHAGLQLTPTPDVRVHTPKPDTQVTTFVVGKICFHTFSSRTLSGAEGDDYQLVDFPQLWPTSGEPLNWATARIVRDSGVDQLSRLLLNSIPPAPH